MRRLAEGDVSALGPIYEAYRSLVLAVIRQGNLGLASAAAEDLCQETFLVLPQAAKRFDASRSLRSYLAGIALQKAREQRRKNWLRENVLGRLGLGRDVPAADGQVEAKLEGQRLLAGLKPEFREVLVLHVAEGLSAEEISEALGISVSTVWTRLHRARQKMAELGREEPTP